VEPQTRTEHDFDFQPTAKNSSFLVPFWGLYYMSTSHIFGKIIFVFYKMKKFQNPTSLFFR